MPSDLGVYQNLVDQVLAGQSRSMAYTARDWPELKQHVPALPVGPGFTHAWW